MALRLPLCFLPRPPASLVAAAATLLQRRHLASGVESQGAGAGVFCKRFVLARHFKGEPKPSDFSLVTEELPPIKDGEVLAEAEFLSLDPYMRVYVLRRPPGGTMIGGQVARVLESKSPDYKVGDHVVGDFGWRTHTVFNPEAHEHTLMRTYKLPDIGGLSPSLGLGVLGMPGNTAYFGLLEVCRPVKGETVVVSGAAGAVGSIVGQIAKIKGCRVVGFAGSDEKVKWLTEELGFDAAYNYKTTRPRDALKDGAPKGVDCYFDNVGGELSSSVINRMNYGGRVAVCGSISSYNADGLPKATIIQPAVVTNELKIEGFLVTRWNDRWGEGILQNLKWIQDGKLKYEETVTKGFENMPSALVGMLRGDNTGKAVVKV
ncbi:hypothetical protein R5R35_002757 [Gryllus longicercus]|uniref:Prostaglandin reductase 1 n=1 Tax=Gryllus longicercus TaxID=2509291 RepID=A0AAN9W1F6_9ORTH